MRSAAPAAGGHHRAASQIAAGTAACGCHQRLATLSLAPAGHNSEVAAPHGRIFVHAGQLMVCYLPSLKSAAVVYGMLKSDIQESIRRCFHIPRHW